MSHAGAAPDQRRRGKSERLQRRRRRTLCSEHRLMVRTVHSINAAVDELGDVLWYVSACCTLLGVTLEDLMEQNLGKVRAKFKKAQEAKYAEKA